MKKKIYLIALILVFILSLFILLKEGYDRKYLERNSFPDDLLRKTYMDIGLISFNHFNSKEVIKNSKIDGLKILTEDLGQRDIDIDTKVGFDVKYKIEYNVKEDPKGYLQETSCLDKYINEELKWSVSLNDFMIENYALSGDNVIIYGRTPSYSSGERTFVKIAMIDKDSNTIWEIRNDNGFRSEYACAVLTDDKEIIIFSRGDFEYLCFTRIDFRGNLTGFKKTKIGNSGIWNAIKTKEGYMLQIGSHVEGKHSSLIKIDHNGIVTRSYTYSSDDIYYYITDMIEFNEKIYLSGYMVEKPADESKSAGGRYDIAAVLNYVFDNELFDITSEELTKLVRNNFTAFLLVCNVDSGDAEKFYVVDFSIGGGLLKADSGELIWEIETITDTFLSLMTSSFTIGGECMVSRLTFEQNGVLVKGEKTQEKKMFRR